MRNLLALASLVLLVCSGGSALAVFDAAAATPVVTQILPTAIVSVAAPRDPLPSCDLVQARLRYREAHTAELDNLLKLIDRPGHKVTSAEVKAVTDMQARSDVDARELDGPGVQLHARWMLPVETAHVVDLAGNNLPKSYTSAEQVWRDANGFMPDGLLLAEDVLTNSITLDITLSLRQLCTDNQDFVLSLNDAAGDSFILSGTWHTP